MRRSKCSAASVLRCPGGGCLGSGGGEQGGRPGCACRLQVCLPKPQVYRLYLGLVGCPVAFGSGPMRRRVAFFRELFRRRSLVGCPVAFGGGPMRRRVAFSCELFRWRSLVGCSVACGGGPMRRRITFSRELFRRGSEVRASVVTTECSREGLRPSLCRLCRSPG